jgi:hypothetical protein
VLYQLMLGTPTALTIWLSLVTASAIGFCVLTAPAVRRRLAAARQLRQRATHERSQLRAHVADLERYAGELAVAAQHSIVTAERRRAEWTTAHRMSEAVWRAYERASLAAASAVAATAFRLPHSPEHTQTEVPPGEHYLRRAAAAAHRRGELSGREYAAVLLHSEGWDPEQNPADLETRLRCVASRRLLEAYLTAAEFERAAWRDATIAAAARDSLRTEAGIATLQVASARHALTSPVRVPAVPEASAGVPLNLARLGLLLGGYELRPRVD